MSAEQAAGMNRLVPQTRAPDFVSLLMPGDPVGQPRERTDDAAGEGWEKGVGTYTSKSILRNGRRIGLTEVERKEPPVSVQTLGYSQVLEGFEWPQDS